MIMQIKKHGVQSTKGYVMYKSVGQKCNAKNTENALCLQALIIEYVYFCSLMITITAERIFCSFCEEF